MLWRRFRYWAWNRRPAKVRAHLALQTLVSPNFCILHRAFHNHCPSNNNMFCYNMAMIVLRLFHVCMQQKYCCILPPSRREWERMQKNAKVFQVRFFCIGLWIHTFALEWKTNPVFQPWVRDVVSYNEAINYTGS